MDMEKTSKEVFFYVCYLRFTIIKSSLNSFSCILFPILLKSKGSLTCDQTSLSLNLCRPKTDVVYSNAPCSSAPCSNFIGLP